MVAMAGIGLCIAKEVLALGASVLIVSRNKENVDSTAGEVSVPLHSAKRIKECQRHK
jgi:NAD(P)-dependent dehydrogenase (short-subunit alcohol dehydrogenase family)